MPRESTTAYVGGIPVKMISNGDGTWSPMGNVEDSLLPSSYADQQLTVDNVVRQFSGFHDETTHVFWSTETADVRVTFDGSNPTTTNGHLIPSGSNGVWPKSMAQAAKFIRTGGSSAIITASQMLVG